MHAKLHDRLVRAVEPTFEPGERAEFTGIARVTSARRNAMVRVAQRKKVAAEQAIARAEAYLVLTDRRMLVVGKGFAARPTTKVLWVFALGDQPAAVPARHPVVDRPRREQRVG